MDDTRPGGGPVRGIGGALCMIGWRDDSEWVSRGLIMISAGLDFPPADSLLARRREKLIGAAVKALEVFRALVGAEGRVGGAVELGLGGMVAGVVVTVDDEEAPVAIESE